MIFWQRSTRKNTQYQRATVNRAKFLLAGTEDVQRTDERDSLIYWRADGTEPAGSEWNL